MSRMTLREAAERTSRSITTLRRYIRSGRLPAEKRNGRYGPEYFVREEDLAQAGLHATDDDATTAHSDGREQALVAPSSRSLGRVFEESVPSRLYQELQMKHEQLLVQYGMMRVGGLRVLELRAELEDARKRLEEAHTEIRSLKERLERQPEPLVQGLREAELELEGRRLEIAALKEKLRGLEMVTRNTVTNETIERRFAEVMKQAREVERMTDSPDAPGRETDH